MYLVRMRACVREDHRRMRERPDVGMGVGVELHVAWPMQHGVHERSDQITEERSAVTALISNQGRTRRQPI